MKTVTTLITDDFTGASGAQTLTFAVDGQTYEIDLCEPNAEKMLAVLTPYMEKGRRIRADNHPTPRKRATTAASHGTPTDVRQWWKDHPDTLPPWQTRGAIPHAVLRAYQQATG